MSTFKTVAKFDRLTEDEFVEYVMENRIDAKKLQKLSQKYDAQLQTETNGKA
jgi:hypothetical protein